MANDLLMISARTPLLDERTGLMSREWFRFFEQMGKKAQIIDGTLTLSASTGAAAALPALPARYMAVTVDGVGYKLPLYNT